MRFLKALTVIVPLKLVVSVSPPILLLWLLTETCLVDSHYQLEVDSGFCLDCDCTLPAAAGSRGRSF